MRYCDKRHKAIMWKSFRDRETAEENRKAAEGRMGREMNAGMEGKEQNPGRERKKPLRGIKIRTMNYVMIFVSFVLYIILIGVTVYASRRYDEMISATDAYIRYQEQASQVREGSDYLTEQVRLYTVEAELSYVENYFQEVYVTRSRDKALEALKEDHEEEGAFSFLQQALDNSNQLMEREIYAMKLVSTARGQDMSGFPDVEKTVLEQGDQELRPEEMTEKARELVFGASYQETKGVIENNVSYFLGSIKDDMKQEQQDSAAGLKRVMARQKVLISVLFVETILTFLLILCLIVKPLHVYVNNIKDEKRLDIVGAYEFKYLALTYNDIYELNAANEVMLRNQAESMRREAEHDPLTGIANRRAFDDWRILLKVRATPLAFLIVDVDRFKQVNDGYGHETGDQVLKKVAALLVETFRDTDVTARIGGDEFAVIVVDIKEDAKDAIRGKINNINHLLLNPTDGLPRVSLSVGGAFSEKGFEDDLYKRADEALYEVKENGRCGCRFCGESGAETNSPA